MNMTNLKKTITATQIIEQRKKIDLEINKLWKIVENENIVPKDWKRNHDLKRVLAFIEGLAQQRSTLKLYNQAINMGYTNLSEFPKNSIYPTIFELGELTEFSVRLSRIKTLSPKAKKYSTKVEAISSKYILDYNAKITLQLVALDKKLADYNNAAVLDITGGFLHQVA